MRTSRLTELVVIAFSIAISIAPNAMAQKSISEMQDIPKLMAIARSNFDLAKQDAVILFEGKKICRLPDGRLTDFTHEIIWINKDFAINHYGDHRVPYDSKNCSFKVVTVRTWRDNQWWETGETGIVETLPYKLEKAYDYANMREMMLLHNGIEIPCILEVAYYIEDKEPFRGGTNGIWSFAKDDPVVWSWFGYGVPKGEKPVTITSNSIGKPEIEIDDKWGLDVYWWKTGPLASSPFSFSKNPASDVPYIAWSDWSSWRALGDYKDGLAIEADDIDSTLALSVDSLIADARTDNEKASLIANYVDEKTSLIEYDNKFWENSPRPAIRTYATAYGHRFDRAILGKALFESAGLQAQIIYIGNAYGDVIPDIPTLDAMTGPSLRLTSDNLDAIYDPSTGKVESGLAGLINRIVWQPGVDNKPNLFSADFQTSTVEIKIDLEYDKADGKYLGKGLYSANNAVCPYNQMIGVGDQTRSFLNRVISGVIPNAKVTNFNPEQFDKSAVRFALELEIEKPELDDLGRWKLVIGEPSTGIFNFLPSDIKLSNQEIDWPIELPSLLTQSITIKLKLSDLQLIYKPDKVSLNNDCGSFAITVSQDNRYLILTRTLSTNRTMYKTDFWDCLRPLLLDEKNEQFNTVIVKAEKAESEK